MPTCSYLTVHNDVDPEYLHGVERVGDAHERSERDQRQCSDGRGQLEAHEVADVVEYALAFLYGGAVGTLEVINKKQ